MTGGDTGDRLPPFFVVGCARSGTTLLRCMLDSHRRLAVPPESHFIPRLAPRNARSAFDIERILENPQIRTWDIDAAAVRSAVVRRQAATFAEQVDALFGLYATARGKQRWGDKTPDYVEQITEIAAIFPDALFVHVIRDGREVATSLAQRAWGPASAVAGAFWWRRQVTRGRRDGAALPADRYLELRLEDLIADPESQLRRLCAFLGEEFDPAMLDYHLTAEARMREPQETLLAFTHPDLAKPPTAGLRDWRAGLSTAEQEAIEAVCAPLLRELGYPTSPVQLRSTIRAYRLRYASALRTLPRHVRARLRPRTSPFGVG
jgi:hypothetical protein